MNNTIYTQNVAVWYGQNANGCQMITYSPQPVTPDEPLVPVVRRRTDWGRILHGIMQVRLQVQDLVGRAVYDKERQQAGVDHGARALSGHVLPQEGFAALLRPGTQPALDISGDDATCIPWEALEEYYVACPECGRRVNLDPAACSEAVFCQRDGAQMQPGGGRLALTHMLTHIVRCRGRATATGNTFLLIKDPSGDLCTRHGTPVQAVENHFKELQRLLTENGYRVKTLANSMATCGRVLGWISKPDVAGIYYYGHGLLREGEGESSLLLHDGNLRARDIEEAGSSASFVFLNACEAGAVSVRSSIEDGLSVASAFATGGPDRAVIAPIFPIETRQAADAALTLFKHAVATGSTAALGLQEVRKKSFEAYSDANLPDTRWMSYRYFGDPNYTLCLQRSGTPVSINTQTDGAVDRVFDDSGRIVSAVFAFGVDAVLLRAAKRRNMQERRQVTCGDLIAGLVRKGELTRFVLYDADRDPDNVYAAVLEHVDPSSEGLSGQVEQADADAETESEEAEDALRRLMARFIVDNKNQFTRRALEALVGADHRAQGRDDNAEGCPIAELDLLEELLSSPSWEQFREVGLPRAEVVRDALNSRDASGIDENGLVRLDSLDSQAQRIIHDAHALAQQRGVFPISNRILLASLLERSDSYASRVCRRAGLPVSPGVLRQIIRATIDQNDHEEAFELSRQACSRIVSAVLDEASRIATDSRISEKDLFRAYCEKAAQAFKTVLKDRLKVDLDRLKTLDPEPEETEDTASDRTDTDEDAGPMAPGQPDISGFSDPAKRIVKKAIELARASGRHVVNSPHLFAAMIECAETELTPLVQSLSSENQNLRDLALSMLPVGSGPVCAGAEITFSTHSRDILQRAELIAEWSKHEDVTREDLMLAFFADGGGAVGRVLALRGIQSITSDEPGPHRYPGFGLN